MAKEVIIKDDLEGSVGAETQRFSLNGVQYEIDLTDGNLKKLAAALDPFINAGRMRGGGASDESESAAIRKWATANRIDVAVKGRIPADVVERWKAAGSPT
jgi:nucleoid-associated protein Lsr2